jgi:maltose O-acetyltransferase
VIGEGVFVNFGAVFLDPAPIHIGDEAQLGPAVQLLTCRPPARGRRPCGRAGVSPAHPDRRARLVGGGVIVCPGVTIGEGTVVGAGSVVIRDLPAGVVAAGNPCRVKRHL